MFLVASSFTSLVLRDVCVVSGNHNFVAEQSLGHECRYRAYGEFSHFVYCILNKNQEEWIALFSEEMGKLHGAEPSVIHRY